MRYHDQLIGDAYRRLNPMKTDYELTGNTYKQLVAFGKMEWENEFKFVGVSVQFKTCKKFKEFLHAKFKNVSIKVRIDK